MDQCSRGSERRPTRARPIAWTLGADVAVRARRRQTVAINGEEVEAIVLTLLEAIDLYDQLGQQFEDLHL